MISKFIIGSFAISLTSVMHMIHEYHLFTFVMLYALHLLANSIFTRYQTTRPLKCRTPAPLRDWAESQRSTFTSF